MYTNVATIPCTFVGDFKVGDNLGYNCDLLCALATRNDDGVLKKAVVLQAGSILEAALNQVIYRAQAFNLEGFPNITEADRLAIEAARIDKFAVTIDVMRKYAVLEGMAGTVYEELHALRRYRNKIHIQDELKIEPVRRDEVAAFTVEFATRTLRLTITVLRYLSDALARPAHIHGYVGDLTCPILGKAAVTGRAVARMGIGAACPAVSLRGLHKAEEPLPGILPLGQE